MSPLELLAAVVASPSLAEAADAPVVALGTVGVSPDDSKAEDFKPVDSRPGDKGFDDALSIKELGSGATPDGVGGVTMAAVDEGSPNESSLSLEVDDVGELGASSTQPVVASVAKKNNNDQVPNERGNIPQLPHCSGSLASAKSCQLESNARGE
jgi:hypothetical protein